MDPIEVTAHFDTQGTVTPLEFRWKGTLHHVESTGRRWKDESGLHILVMVMSGRMLELTYLGGERRWFVSRAAPDHALV